MTRRGLVFVPVLLGSLALVAEGCGGSTSSSNGSGGSAGASGASTGGSGTGGAATGGSGGTGGSGTGGAAGSGGGGSCNTDSDCPKGELCGFDETAGCAAKGSCYSAEPLCSGVDIGCGCNGATFNIVCEGLPNGVVGAPLLHKGPCGDGGAMFPCGSSLSCDAAWQYCKVAEGGPCCSPPSYSCEPIPSGCVHDQTCACLSTAVPGGATCDSSNGGLTLTFAYP